MSAESDEEFREFMRGRWAATVRLAYGLTGDTGHAEDVAQDAFARAYASWGRVSRAGDPQAYVRRIVINEYRRRFRKQRVAEELPGVLPDAGTVPPGPEERSALLDALRSLGPRQRAVIVLRYWMDLSEREIAQAMGVSPGTVKSNVSRGLAALARALGDRS